MSRPAYPYGLDDVGGYFVDEGGQVWVCESYCPYPTVTLRRLESEYRVSGAVGAPNLNGFKRLVVEEREK